MNNQLTLREMAAVWLYRQIMHWMVGMTDSEFALYMTMPAGQKMVLMRSQPFYNEYERLITA